MTNKEKELRKLIDEFNNDSKNKCFVIAGEVKDFGPSEKELKAEFKKYSVYVNDYLERYTKINGLYTDNKRANGLIKSFEALAGEGLFDLDTMQAEAQNYICGYQLLANVSVMVHDAINNINKYSDKLIIMYTDTIKSNNPINKYKNSYDCYTDLLDNFLKDKWIHPNEQEIELLKDFKKEYEEIEQA